MQVLIDGLVHERPAGAPDGVGRGGGTCPCLGNMRKNHVGPGRKAGRSPDAGDAMGGVGGEPVTREMGLTRQQ